jgi:hypothetical protein
MHRVSAPHRRDSGRVLMAVLLTVALAVGSLAAAATAADLVRSRLGGETVTSAKTAADPHRKGLIVKAKVVGGPLVPGVTRRLKVTMTNPLSQRLKVTRVTVKVKRPPAAGCRPSWVKASSFAAGRKAPPVIVKPRRSVSITLSVRLKNLRTVNQDACKNTTIPMAVKATAKPG